MSADRPDAPEAQDAPGACAPPYPPRQTRADVEAKWAAIDREQRLRRRADLWSAADPRDREACAFTHWLALLEAGKIGGAGSEGRGEGGSAS